MTQYIVVTGNPMDGLDFTGPFEDPEAAIEWAKDALPTYAVWHVTELQEPV